MKILTIVLLILILSGCATLSTGEKVFLGVIAVFTYHELQETEDQD